MFLHYIKFFLRSITKNVYYYTLIGICLITAIATASLIYSYSSFENSYDRQHQRLKDLYRVNFTIHKNGNLESENANSTPVIGPLLYNELSGVEDFARLYPRSGSTVQILDKDDEWSIYPEDKIYHADSSFLKMFSFPLLIGDQENVLKKPFHALLSKSFALKMFASIEDAMGKTFKLSEEETYTIEGIFDDIPINSHLNFESLLSYSTLEVLDWTRESINTDWGWYSHYNFLLLNENRNIDSINEEILSITKPHTKAIGERINGGFTYTLHPVEDIYLESDVFGEMDRKGNGFVVRFMNIIAILILILTFTNYAGITASINLDRVKETGLRKIFGSKDQRLWISFVLESVVLITVSFSIAIFLLSMFWGNLPALTGMFLPISIILSLKFFVISLLSVVLISLVCGTYHYFLVTGPDLITALKGADSPGNSSYVFRKAILFIQYLAGASLLILTMIVYDQVGLLTKEDPGFEHKNTLALKLRRTRGDADYFRKINTFSKAIKNVSGVQLSALSSHIPSEEIGWTSGGKITGQLTTVKFHHYAIDEGFTEVYGMEMAEGSAYDGNSLKNQRSIIINEQGAKILGFEKPADAINKTFLYGGREANPYTIIGVIKDHYQRGLKYQVYPIAFHYLPDHAIYTGSSYSSLKITASTSLTQIKEAIEEVWQDNFGDTQIEYSDVDQKYLDQYQTDRKALDLLTFFTFVAIMIATFGLIGLVAFSTKQRAKEIGIRKVLGASIRQIIYFLSKSYLSIVLLAIIVSWFISYFILESWLQNYPQRVSIDFMIFIIVAAIILLLSMALIIFQSWKSGVKNPVAAMRTD